MCKQRAFFNLICAGSRVSETTSCSFMTRDWAAACSPPDFEYLKYFGAVEPASSPFDGSRDDIASTVLLISAATAPESCLLNWLCVSERKNSEDFDVL